MDPGDEVASSDNLTKGKKARKNRENSGDEIDDLILILIFFTFYQSANQKSYKDPGVEVYLKNNRKKQTSKRENALSTRLLKDLGQSVFLYGVSPRLDLVSIRL